MPIYAYECLDCSGKYDVLCKMSEADEAKTCTACGSKNSKRRIAGGHFELKGSGWYKDGYSSSKP